MKSVGFVQKAAKMGTRNSERKKLQLTDRQTKMDGGYKYQTYKYVMIGVENQLISKCVIYIVSVCFLDGGCGSLCNKSSSDRNE